jgi:hypothetical protein
MAPVLDMVSPSLPLSIESRSRNLDRPITILRDTCVYHHEKLQSTCDPFGVLQARPVHQADGFFTLFSSPPPTVPRTIVLEPDRVIYGKGDPVTFPYGAHEDESLLAEYGFVLGRTNEFNSVEVTAAVNSLMDGERLEILAEHGYKGRVEAFLLSPISKRSKTLSDIWELGAFEGATSWNGTRRHSLRIT